MKTNPVFYLASELWRNATGVRLKVVIYVVMAVGGICLMLLVPLLIRELINSIQSMDRELLVGRAGLILGAYLGIELLFWAFHGPSRVIERDVAFTIKRNYQSSLFRKVTALPMRWQKSHHSGETIDQVSKAVQALGDFSETSFELLHLFVRYLGSVVMLILFMPQSGIVILISTTVVTILIVLFDRRLIQQYRSLNKKLNGVASVIQDYLTNIATVISLRLENQVNKEVYDRTTKIRSLNFRNIKLNELKWFCTSITVNLTQITILGWYVVNQVNSKQVVEIGTIYALWEYLRNVSDSFFQFTYKYGDLVVKSTRVRAVEHIDDAYRRDVQEHELAKLPVGWNCIDISNVEFSHGDEESEEGAARIENLSLRLERGKSYAFVGESGSGKSTTLGLIRGLHLAERAEVSCDGVLLPFGLAHLAHCATLIPQDPEIFSDSLRFNVSMGVDADERQLMHAVRAACFAPVVDRLPRGIESGIAEKGVNLSGGEKQRLALARGIYFAQASDIVLLDEPTSSVDPFNERQIYETLLAEYRNRCVISSIHKFHLLPLFDQIVVFQRGRVVEQGTLSELLASNGEFVRIQASGGRFQ